MLLLHRRKVTARELADYFEVSVRTIQRDMDTLCGAGIPIYGDVGKQGGYQLTENYRLDRSFLTRKEMDTLVPMLRGFSDTLFDDSLRTILEKVAGIKGEPSSFSHLRIDMTPWGAERDFHEVLNLIDNALKNHFLLTFEYFDLYNRKTERTAEPYTIILKGGSWYLYAYCLLREEYRLFKISRIFELRCDHQRFIPRSGSEDLSILEKIDRDRQAERIVIRFNKDARGRIPDFFDPRLAVEDDEGSLTFDLAFPVDEWLVNVFLGLSDCAEILEPLSLREEICKRIKKMKTLYKL